MRPGNSIFRAGLFWKIQVQGTNYWRPFVDLSKKLAHRKCVLCKLMSVHKAAFVLLHLNAV
eukprot:1159951-Pelagomonas_calceolata.AAC.9